jgi:hypothetical protein
MALEINGFAGTSYIICFRCRHLVSWSAMYVHALFKESLERVLEFSLGNKHLEWLARASVLG